MTKRVQWLALTSLVAVWAVAAYWVTTAGGAKRAPLAYTTGQVVAASAARAHAGPKMTVHLDQLEAARRAANEALGSPKNIFAPLAESEPPLPTKRKPGRAMAAKASAAPAVTVPAAPPPPTPEELAAQAARGELAQFRYLGYLNRGGESQAFLAKGTELFIVKNSQTIEQSVVVKAVTPVQVVLQEIRTRVEQTVPILAGAP